MTTCHLVSRRPFHVALLLGLLLLQADLRAETATPAAAATAAIDQRLARNGANPFTINLLDHANFDTSDLTWRSGLWCADWIPYFTCFSPWNSNEHAFQGGTLITPKHALFAEHFSGKSGSNPLHAGDVFYFLGKSNVLYKRKLQATPARVGGSDLCLGTFDRDLPPDVIPAQVLPAGLPSNFLPPGTPVLFTNKNKELRVAEVASFGQQAIRPAQSPLRAPWTLPGPAAIGDSGCPVFILLNDRPVLWWLFHFPNAGESISANLSVLNSMVGKGYKLDVATVKGF